MNRDEILTYLKSIKPMLAKQYLISDIALYGSHAIGCAGETSDIDILITFKGHPDFLMKENAREIIKKLIREQFRRNADVLDADTVFIPIIKKMITQDAIHV